MGSNTIDILLLEDNPADATLFRQATAGRFNVTVAQTGAEALDLLFQRGRFSKSPRPHMLVLDLNVPILSGHEVINVIKSNSSLRSLPIIVISLSGRVEDVQKAYDLGACSYIVKSSDLTLTEKALSALVEFWAGYVAYPNVAPPGQALSTAAPC